MVHQSKDHWDVPTLTCDLLQSPKGWDLLIKAVEKKNSPLLSQQEYINKFVLVRKKQLLLVFGVVSKPLHPFQTKQEAANPQKGGCKSGTGSCQILCQKQKHLHNSPHCAYEMQLTGPLASCQPNAILTPLCLEDL